MKLPKHHFKRNRGQRFLREAAACIPDQAALDAILARLHPVAREFAREQIAPYLAFVTEQNSASGCPETPTA